MNAEAEAEIERMLINWGPLSREYCIRSAMAWAYRDAARVCRDAKAGTPTDLVAEAFASTIESRLAETPKACE